MIRKMNAHLETTLDSYPLQGTVIRYEDPFEPAIFS